MTFKAFMADDSGAVAVDWVVLTGALVGLGIATMAVVSGGVENLSGDIGQDLANIDVGGQFADWFASAGPSAGWGALALLNGMGLDAQHYQNFARFGWGGSDGAPMSDAQLASLYSEVHDSIAAQGGWYHGDGVDALGALEVEMRGRGLDIPEGNLSYETAHADFASAQG